MKWFVLLLSIGLGSVGQILFKMAVNGKKGGTLQFFLSLLTDFHLLAGALAYGASFVLWIWVLQYFEVSLARPLTALGYVVTYGLAILLLGEPLTLARVVAVSLIVAGSVILVL